jgi:site-specific DNA recombinase
MRVYGYIRTSTNKQEVSLEVQEAKIRATAFVKDYGDITIIKDGDESAKSLARPGMEKLLNLIDSEEVDVLIISKLDRITRSLADLAELMKRFTRHGVKLISLQEAIDIDSATGRMLLNILTAFSQFERELTGERTEAALQHLKSQGFPAGPAPYGWLSQPRTSEEKQLKIRKPLLIDEAEQEILGKANAMREAGLSYEKIADSLNARGFKTRSEGKWVKQYVIGILKNPRVTA